MPNPTQRNQFIEAISCANPQEHLDDKGNRYHKCAFCGAEARMIYRNNEWVNGPMPHTKGCLYVYSKEMEAHNNEQK